MTVVATLLLGVTGTAAAGGVCGDAEITDTKTVIYDTDDSGDVSAGDIAATGYKCSDGTSFYEESVIMEA